MNGGAPRIAVGAIGVVVALWGVWLISGSADFPDLVNIAVWLGVGVVAHDVGIAGITLVVAAVATKVLPEVAKAPATVGMIVLGAVTVVSIPIVGRFGARADNPTLLDRNYIAGYLGIAAVVVVCVVVASIVRSRQSAQGEPVTGS